MTLCTTCTTFRRYLGSVLRPSLKEVNRSEAHLGYINIDAQTNRLTTVVLHCTGILWHK